jgi:putative transposase
MRAVRRTFHCLSGQEQTHLSIGNVGDSYDKAMVDSIIGLFKTEVIRPGGTWGSIEAVDLAMLVRVDWFNNWGRLGLIGDISPVTLEQAHPDSMDAPVIAAGLNNKDP